jgi:hypothetical protein
MQSSAVVVAVAGKLLPSRVRSLQVTTTPLSLNPQAHGNEAHVGAFKFADRQLTSDTGIMMYSYALTSKGPSRRGRERTTPSLKKGEHLPWLQFAPDCWPAWSQAPSLPVPVVPLA